MPDIHKQYEAKLQRLINSYLKRIENVYHDAIKEVSFQSSMLTYEGQTFNLDTSPILKRKIDEILSQMHSKITDEIIKSTEQSWQLSNHKNDVLTDSVVGETVLTERAKQLLYNPNHDALSSFIKRSEKGLNLSKRVWNLVEPYKYELEAGLADAINRGQSAAQTASTLKKFLNEPDKLFRRVRDENGNLQLSKAAKNYHPGQGVYRSSYKNALRLTATENNIAYRTADNERWKKQPFTKGIEIVLSKSHPEFDICDELKGKYPKDFKFTGWHPKCLCYATPVLATDAEFNDMEDELLGISKTKPDITYIEKPPAAFDKWISENEKRIAGWKSKPYFLKDNKKYVSLS
jgi:hypothetical protein